MQEIIALHIHRRIGEEISKVQRNWTTQRTYRNMHDSMEIGTTRGIATSIYPHIGRHHKELVYKIRTS